jgi:myo-inositol-1(or 4)-monophosphatase
LPGPDPHAAPGPEAELALLVQAAEAAGKIALGFWRREPKAWDKADASPVSEADLAVDAALRVLLAAERPDYGWLSEESPDGPEEQALRQAAKRVFILDPIDGTRAFLAGEEAFAVSLALVEQGRVLAGVVHLPAMGRTYCAAAGGTARRDGAVLAVSTRADLAGAEVLATRPTMAPELWPQGVPQVKRSFRASLAWRLCLVAEGRFDAMITLRGAREWDIAAGSLIAERAGARVTDRHGRPLAFNAPLPEAEGTLCAPPALHAQLLRALQP